MTPHHHVTIRPPLGDVTVLLSHDLLKEHDRIMRPFLHQLLQSSRMLQLSVETTFTAAVLLHRYQIIRIEETNHHLPMDPWIVSVCLLLACKREEEPRRLRDFINCFYFMQHRPLPDLDDTYWEDKKKLVRTEQIVLRWLKFDLMVWRPHRAVVALLLPFFSDNDDNNNKQHCRELARSAFRKLNHTVFSIEALQQEVDVLAVAALRLALIEASDRSTTTWPEEKRQHYHHVSLQIGKEHFGMQTRPAALVLKVQDVVKQAITANDQETQLTHS